MFDIENLRMYSTCNEICRFQYYCTLRYIRNNHGVSKNERFSFEIQSKWLIRKKTGEKMLHVEINGSSKSNEPDEKH